MVTESSLSIVLESFEALALVVWGLTPALNGTDLDSGSDARFTGWD